MFYSTKAICLWVCIILIGLGKPKVCVNLFGIGEPFKLPFGIGEPFKGGSRKRKTEPYRASEGFLFETLTSSYRRKSFCCIFLYAFRFYNQTKSLASTLKILLVFLCEAATNQLQQLKGCCGVSHVLGSMYYW